MRSSVSDNKQFLDSPHTHTATSLFEVNGAELTQTTRRQGTDPDGVGIRPQKNLFYLRGRFGAFKRRAGSIDDCAILEFQYPGGE